MTSMPFDVVCLVVVPFVFLVLCLHDLFLRVYEVTHVCAFKKVSMMEAIRLQ